MTLASRDEAVENIRQRTDIVELISRYVKLKKAGSNFVGLCPFHAEKTGSFTVSPRKGFFHCFGCKTSGDAFSFLMKIEGKTFPEVLEDLAARAGVELPQRRRVNQQARELSQRLLEINELATAFYERSLWDSKTGSRARAYLSERGLEQDLCRRFRLGYAPGGWRNLADYLQQSKLSLQEAQTLGLLAAGDRGHYDIFRDRLVFPIAGINGKVSGFGARKLDSDTASGPKYINSRQSRVYDKSEILYGLYQARAAIQSSDQAILVEGYFDVLSLVQAGVENVVATCGTALSENHVWVIKRFAEKVVTIFDADPAGLSASYRSTALLLGEDLSPYMVTLPAGEDPDSLVRSRGRDEFMELLTGARPTIEVLADMSLKEAAADVEARTSSLKKLIPMIAASQDSLRLGNYLRLVADRFDLDEAYLRQAVSQHRQQKRVDISSSPVGSGDVSGGISLQIEEETCLTLLLKFPRLAKRVSDSGVLERFESKVARGLAHQIIDAGPHLTPAAFLDNIEDDQLRDRLSGKVIDEAEAPEDKADYSLEDCIRNIYLRHIKRELRSLSGQISQAEKDGREEERKQLTMNKIRLDQERKSLEIPAGRSL